MGGDGERTEDAGTEREEESARNEFRGDVRGEAKIATIARDANIMNSCCVLVGRAPSSPSSSSSGSRVIIEESE